MKRMFKCLADHVWLEEQNGPNEFGRPHVGCGAAIGMCGYVSSEEEKQIFNCRICGNMELARYIPEVSQRLIRESLCFDCDFWQEKIRWRKENKPDVYVINGRHYKVKPDLKPTSPSHCAGYGGAHFVIRPHGGKPLETRNLWHQGEVPKRFRSELPDNAKFIPIR